MAILFAERFEFDLQIELPNRQIELHRRIAICLRLNRSDGEAGSRPARRVPSRPGGYWKTRRAETGALPLKDIPAQWAKIRQGLDIFRISSKCVCLSNGEV